MAVLIGHASISENGTINGQPGDQTGKEVCTRYWYNKPWNVMLICTDKELAKRAAQEMRYACANDNVGYGQNDRTTAYTKAKAIGTFKGSGKGNTDCSQLYVACYILAGLTSLSPNCYTGNMRQALLNTGKFKAYTDSAHISTDAYAEIGACYLKEGSHVVMALENGSKASGTTSGSGSTSTGNTTSKSARIKSYQAWLNMYYVDHLKKYCGATLVADGIWGTKTYNASVSIAKLMINKKYGGTLTLNNYNWLDTCKKQSKNAFVQKGNSGTLVAIVEGVLTHKGYYTGEIDAIFGSGLYNAVIAFQKANGLTADGVVGVNTYYALFNN